MDQDRRSLCQRSVSPAASGRLGMSESSMDGERQQSAPTAHRLQLYTRRARCAGRIRGYFFREEDEVDGLNGTRSRESLRTLEEEVLQN